MQAAHPHTITNVIRLPAEWMIFSAIQELNACNFDVINAWLSPCEIINGKRYENRLQRMHPLLMSKGRNVNLVRDFRLSIQGATYWLEQQSKDWALIDQWLDGARALPCWKREEPAPTLTLVRLLGKDQEGSADQLRAYLTRFPERLNDPEELNWFCHATTPEAVEVLIDFGYQPTTDRATLALEHMITDMTQFHGAAERLLCDPHVILSPEKAMDLLDKIEYNIVALRSNSCPRTTSQFIGTVNKLLDFCDPASNQHTDNQRTAIRNFFEVGYGKNLILRWLANQRWPEGDLSIVPLFERMIRDFGVHFDASAPCSHPAGRALAETLMLKKTLGNMTASKAAIMPRPRRT